MGVLDWTNNPYPAPRKNRKPVAATSQGAADLAAPAPPNVSIITMFARESVNVGNCVTIVSRRIVGPAFIDYFAPKVANTAPGDVWRVVVSDDQSGSQTNVAGFEVVTGDPIFETAAREGAAGGNVTSRTAIRASYIAAVAGGQTFPFKVGKVITKPEFYIKATYTPIGASATQPGAIMRVVENIDPEQLADYVLHG